MKIPLVNLFRKEEKKTLRLKEECTNYNSHLRIDSKCSVLNSSFSITCFTFILLTLISNQIHIDVLSIPTAYVDDFFS